MDVVEPDPTSAAAVVVDHLRAVDAPAAAVGDPAEFLDIDMEQIAGVRVLVSQLGSPGSADPHPGDRVELGQSRQPGPGDQPRHRRWADPGALGDLIASQTL